MSCHQILIWLQTTVSGSQLTTTRSNFMETCFMSPVRLSSHRDSKGCMDCRRCPSTKPPSRAVLSGGFSSQILDPMLRSPSHIYQHMCHQPPVSSPPPNNKHDQNRCDSSCVSVCLCSCRKSQKR